MAKFIIQGGHKLQGETRVFGNKNAILPIMAATILTSQDCILENVPQISDVQVMGEILQDLGAKVQGLGTNRLVINTKNIKKTNLNPELVAKLRASILLMGPILARFGQVSLRHPGGCLIGRRPVGTHFDALGALGAEIITGEVDYQAKITKLSPAKIFLEEASVTATENALMMASLIPGQTVIEDAACEPHVEDLANFLAKLGVKIEGAGTNRILIEGKNQLNGASHQISPDYIDVATLAIMAGVTKGEITIKNINSDHLKMILLYFQKLHLQFEIKADQLKILPSHLQANNLKIQDRPWPGFPTDLMSPMIVLATQSKGTTLCHEWMYESRMFFIDKLITMGANITLCDPHRALVVGPTKLRGKNLDSPDIRAGVALVAAALCAEGESIINQAEMIDRGYENIDQRLQSLGAKIKRVD